MNKNEVMVIWQALNSMQNIVSKLEEYLNKKDVEKVESIKKEIMKLGKEIESLL